MSSLLVSLFEDFLGESKKHNDSTGQVAFDCPSCAADKGVDSDGKGNLEVNYNKNVFKCWACAEINNMHGVIPKLIKRYGNKEILKTYQVLKPEFIEEEKTKETFKQLTLPEDYTPFSKKTQYLDEPLKYIKKRGIDNFILEKFQMGYNKDRIIIPSYDFKNNLNYYVGRSFRRNIKPKYMNPDVDKSTLVFNERLINFKSTIYLVEGVFDHIVINNSIPLLGKFINNYLLYLLHEKAEGDIIIILDSDAKEDAIRLYHKLNMGKLFGRIHIVHPPDGHDPSSIYKHLGSRGIVKLMSRTYQIH